MTKEQLLERQTPLKSTYRENAEAAMICLSAEGSLGEGVSCSVHTGRALATAGLHPASGGDGTQLCSGDMLLEALVACAGVTLKAVATSMEIPLDEGRIRAEGDLDFRGTLGVDKTVAVGFQSIRLFFHLKSSAPEEQLQKLLSVTERFCVVLQTISKGCPVHSQLQSN